MLSLAIEMCNREIEALRCSDTLRRIHLVSLSCVTGFVPLKFWKLCFQDGSLFYNILLASTTLKGFHKSLNTDVVAT